MKKTLSLLSIIATLLFFSPVPYAQAAGISFDAVTCPGNFTTSPATFSHTTTGTNRILFVLVEGDFDGDFVTGVTYGGVSMTLAIKSFFQSGRWYYVFYLVNPASGANTVSITNPTSPGNGYGACAISYTGASQTGQPDNSVYVQQTGNTTTFAPTITTSANNSWVVSILNQNFGAPITTGAGATQRGVINSATDFITDSNGAVTPAGVYTMNYSTGSSRPWSSLLVSFAPTAATMTGTFNFWQFFDF